MAQYLRHGPVSHGPVSKTWPCISWPGSHGWSSYPWPASHGWSSYPWPASHSHMARYTQEHGYLTLFITLVSKGLSNHGTIRTMPYRVPTPPTHTIVRTTSHEHADGRCMVGVRAVCTLTRVCRRRFYSFRS